MNEAEANPGMEKKCPQCGATLPEGGVEGLCPACLLKQGSTETATQSEMPAFQPPSVEELAKLFPQLEIIALIGKGGMGAVYKARQPGLDRLVALKILPPQIATGPGFTERFNREARALARLSHPNIVAVHEFGQVRIPRREEAAGGTAQSEAIPKEDQKEAATPTPPPPVGGSEGEVLPYFIMEFVDGLNLRQLERAGKLTPREALQIVPQICEALQFAHDEGVVHRDVKPENILVDKKGRVKIADFGIAKIIGRAAEPALTETRGVIGTPQYMAPEQVERPQQVDHRADIFSLGVVFYEMLTGELPLGKFAPPSRKVQVDVRLDEVVLKSLEKEPEHRYQHASQVKTAVETINSTAPPLVPEDAQTLSNEILQRDYTISIGHCLRRGWEMVRSDFWPIIGITALILVLVQAASGSSLIGINLSPNHTLLNTSLLGLLVLGPLMGGLYLTLLRKIRGERATAETAFSGFSNRFLQLFLGGFVPLPLIALGLLCCIAPGIFLLVCWKFTLPLIVDRGLDFWSAMMLSMKMVRKHWWKIFGLVIVLVLVGFSGLLAFGIGFFITAPIALCALMYAYEDIFGEAGKAVPAGATAGFPGVRRPEPTPMTAGIPGPAVAGIAVGIVALGAVVFLLGLIPNRRQTIIVHDSRPRVPVARQRGDREPQSVKGGAQALTFGAVNEKLVTNGINLANGRLISVAMTYNSDDPRDKVAENIRHMEIAGVDAYILADNQGGTTGKLYGLGLTLRALDSEDWNQMTPAQLDSALAAAASDSDSLLKMEAPEDGYNTYAFRTREGARGMAQVTLADAERGAVKLRYKLVEKGGGGPRAISAKDRKALQENLSARFEAAILISNTNDRDEALATLTKDAASAGEADLIRQFISMISNSETQGEAAHDAAIMLAKRGQMKQATAIAQTISEGHIRDQTLSELVTTAPNHE